MNKNIIISNMPKEVKEKVLEALCDSTRLKILGFLAEDKLTLTEITNKLPEIKNRSSVYKALQKLHEASLIDRTHDLKLNGYYYSLGFKSIEISDKIRIQIKK